MGIIYKLTSPSGKEYVGLTTKTLEKRMANHLLDSKNEKYKHRPLYRAFNKYGFNNFKIEKLADGDYTLKELQDLEIKFIEEYDTFNNGYNCTSGGEGTIGFKFSEESLSNLRNRPKPSIDMRNNISERNSGVNNPMYGVRGSDAPSATKVKCVELDMVFDTVKECAEYLLKNGYVDTISTGNISNAKNRKGSKKMREGYYKGFKFDKG